MSKKPFSLKCAQRVSFIILILAIIAFLYGIIGRFLCTCPFVNIDLTNCLAVVLASLTMMTTINEYLAHRERIKSEVLGQYNERYSKDKHVNKVVDYIIHYLDRKNTFNLPSTHNAEMFMRFFEEMEIQIVKERLDEHQVYSLFAYYAIKFGEDERLRLIMGICDYDDSRTWKHFKEFVNRMLAIQQKENDGKKLVSDKTNIEFIPICFLYNEIIKKRSCWDYYGLKMDVKDFNLLYNNGDSNDSLDKNYEFIVELLKAGGKKLSANLIRCLNALKENEQNINNIELNGRLRHIVSLFFWGHVLCLNIPVVKTQIEQQINQFINNGMFDVEDDIQHCFSFMWFLLCIFHDFGYAYEKNLIPKVDIEHNLYMPNGFLPSIYSTGNIMKYAQYRHCVFGCNDHGIYGGRVFYNEMLEIGNRIATDNKLKIRFRTDGVDKIYQYAAWVISCHNIFYNKGNDDYTSCYKCNGLDDFIKPNARCLTLNNNPLLFLFCLADSIEPTKVLTYKDGINNKKLFKELNICFKKEHNIMIFDLSKIPCKEAVERYKNKIIGLDDWLINVSDNLILKFE